MDKIKVSAISYLNTKPFLYGLERDKVADSIDITYDYPSACVEKLISGSVDIGIVSVTALPFISEPHIVSDYCIGGNHSVKSVLLASNSPLDSINTIYLDYQSNTSVMLCRVLSLKYWNITPKFVDTKEGFDREQLLSGEALLFIGDKTFGAEDRFDFTYDLCREWREFTGEEFVFALWIANRSLEPQFKESFNRALAFGVDSLDSVINENQKDFPQINLDRYFHENICYNFSDSKKRGLKLFFHLISEIVAPEEAWKWERGSEIVF